MVRMFGIAGLTSSVERIAHDEQDTGQQTIFFVKTHEEFGSLVFKWIKMQVSELLKFELLFLLLP